MDLQRLQAAGWAFASPEESRPRPPSLAETALALCKLPNAALQGPDPAQDGEPHRPGQTMNGRRTPGITGRSDPARVPTRGASAGLALTLGAATGPGPLLPLAARRVYKATRRGTDGAGSTWAPGPEGAAPPGSDFLTRAGGPTERPGHDPRSPASPRVPPPPPRPPALSRTPRRPPLRPTWAGPRIVTSRRGGARRLDRQKDGGLTAGSQQRG